MIARNSFRRYGTKDMMIPKPELVSPGGSLEKAKTAFRFGADAVYVGGPMFNLREGAKNLSFEEIEHLCNIAHQQCKRVYLTLNVYARNHQLTEIERFLTRVKSIPLDALIISDPAVICLTKEVGVNIPIHLSTQTNTTNWKAVEFWREQGVKRIILARELSLEEVSEITKKTRCETEAFVHGSMCISYSGRCLLSAYMAYRSANLGDCAHSCRWRYRLLEEKRPNEYFPIFEDESGSFIISSRDLCMIEHVPELISAGLNAWKIEGRMKSEYYVAAVTRIYREAIDSYTTAPNNYQFNEDWIKELEKVSHRQYYTGFYFGAPSEAGQAYMVNMPRNLSDDEARSRVSSGATYIRTHDFLGVVTSVKRKNLAQVAVRGKIQLGDELEVVTDRIENDYRVRVKELLNEDFVLVSEVNNGQRVFLNLGKKAKERFLLRKRV